MNFDYRNRMLLNLKEKVTKRNSQEKREREINSKPPPLKKCLYVDNRNSKALKKF